jgi:hypothetical protein
MTARGQDLGTRHCHGIGPDGRDGDLTPFADDIGAQIGECRMIP